MDWIIAILVLTCWIWGPLLWALVEGWYQYRVNGLVWDTLTSEYVTPERWQANHDTHYGDRGDE